MRVSPAPRLEHAETAPQADPVGTTDGVRGGWIETNPRFRVRLTRLGLTTPDVILALPGEVVSGHADRHVVRVESRDGGTAFYLKRQHHVGWRERVRQWAAGYGWASRCGREARLLRELELGGFPCPAWVATGEDGRGRAFLLVEELVGPVELRRLLRDTRLTAADRSELAARLGRAVAELHAAGFDTPDLTAKHVFAEPDSFGVTLIDWQSARRVNRLGNETRGRALAALHASLADHLATPRERLRFLWAYHRAGRRLGRGPLAREVVRLAEIARRKRSVRDQRQSVVAGGGPQRLVWLAGEAVCAVPDVAAVWPTPAIAHPFYPATPPVGEAPGSTRLADGRAAVLIRGTTCAPVARLASWARGRSWRSPGVTLGRLLFHLERYGVPAPGLFAFGQRLIGRTSADWFALHAVPSGLPLATWLARPVSGALRRDVFGQVGLVLRQLHDAGCRYTRGPLLWVADDNTGRVTVGGIRGVRIVKKLTASDRRNDLLRLLGGLPASRADRLRAVRGYYGGGWAKDQHTRRAARFACFSGHAGGRS